MAPQPHLYSLVTFRFVLQVIEAVVAVAVVAELPVCKAVAVSVVKHICISECGNQEADQKRNKTHSLRHCDLVQLQGFLGLGAVSVVDVLQANKYDFSLRRVMPFMLKLKWLHTPSH